MKTAQVTLSGADRLRFFLYNTACEVQISQGGDRTALVEALKQAQRVQALLDVFDPTSALAKVNASQAGVPVPVYPELFSLLRELRRAYEISEGAYDATLRPVIALWNFSRGGSVPTARELGEALAVTGFGQVLLDERAQAVGFAREGVGIDAGGAGKGYAAQCIRTALVRAGVSRAAINLGGNLCTVGAGSWRIGVQKPWSPRGEVLGLLELPACCVSTSSGCERYFISGGRLYHHLLDPRTGYPADCGIASATVVCTSPLWSDILSTIFFVGGEQTGCAAMEALGLEGLCGYVLVTNDGGLRVSPALLPFFTEYARQTARTAAGI